MSALESVLKLQARMGQSIIGQESVIEQLIIGLLANGNILMEGLPGLAKTRAVKSLAKNMDAEFSRIQFTPDLLPSAYYLSCPEHWSSKSNMSQLYWLSSH